MGTEEDGVDEAGRATEPSLMVAPPGRDIDPDVRGAEAVVENGGMSSSRTRSGSSRPGSPGSGASAVSGAKAAKEDAEVPAAPDDAVTGTGGESHRNGSAANGSVAGKGKDDSDSDEHSRRVPFPADDIGKPKGSAHESAADSPSPDGDRPDGSATSPNGVLDSGRQAVRHAMAATNNFFTTRAKGDSASADGAAPDDKTSTAAAPTGSSGSPDSLAGDRGPSFTASSQDTADSARQASPGASLWRDVPASSSASAASPAASQSRSSFSGQSYSPPPSASGQSSTSPSPGRRPSAPASSGSGFSATGAASAVGGAAAGLAGSVTNAWQNRYAGAKRKQGNARRSTRRQAQLTLARVEPWSVMKFSFVVSVVAFIILFVAVAVLYMVLSSLGVFTSLQHTVSTITSSQGSSGTNISNWFSASRILGYTGMLGALNIVLITAMSTIGAVIYNLIARTIGGVEVTLRETD